MTKVKDPVCQMTFEHSMAGAKGDYHGETIYFCSAGCQKAYERTHPPSR